MAVTGRGDFPLRSAWLSDLQSAGIYSPVSLLYRDRATDTIEPWADWFFEPASAAPISGTASQTLGAVTNAATGTLRVSGAVAATLGAVTLAGVSGLVVAGQAAQTLGAFTLAATGEQAATAISGQAAMTLGGFAQSSAGAVLVRGDASQALGALTQAAAGSLRISGTLSATLGEVTASASGELVVQAIEGVFDVTLGNFCMKACGTIRDKAPRVNKAAGAYGDRKRGSWKYRR